MQPTLEKIISLCKRRGFVFQSSDIYGGLNGVYDFGPLGAAMKENLRALWKLSVSTFPAGETVFMEGSVLGGEPVWKASGHIQNFHDPMIDCLSCKRRFRADELGENPQCPACGARQWTEVREFNLMFKTQLGAVQDVASAAYLRPETAQAIFINFKNVYSSCRVKIPFGIGQVGKSFRNEITPKQFLFRTREFEQMEIEWFCRPTESDTHFDMWLAQRQAFYRALGVNMAKLRFRPHASDELAHYSKNCTDVEYEFPFGWKELEGIAHRSDFDLRQHSQHSGKDLGVYDDAEKLSYVPHVVECSVGTDRLFLTLLFDAYYEDVVDGEERIVLRLHPKVAPIKAAFFPLTKKQEAQTQALFNHIRQLGYAVTYDVSGSIGKRYRRQDEIGTPLCFTYDFESDEDRCVTVRHRDTMAQERISIDKVAEYITAMLQK